MTDTLFGMDIMHPTFGVYIDKTGVAHQLTHYSTNTPTWLTARCLADIPPQFGKNNIVDGPVTCMACLGQPTWESDPKNPKFHKCVSCGRQATEWSRDGYGCEDCIESY